MDHSDTPKNPELGFICESLADHLMVKNRPLVEHVNDEHAPEGCAVVSAFVVFGTEGLDLRITTLRTSAVINEDKLANALEMLAEGIRAEGMRDVV